MAATNMCKIKLIANDETTFEVDQDVAFKSEKIKNFCAKQNAILDIKITEIDADGKTLEKIIDYCVEHKNEKYEKKSGKENQRMELTEKQKKYLEGVSDEFLVNILMGAVSLEIPGLVDMTSQTVADMISEEIRKIYCDDTPQKVLEDHYNRLNN